ncbi:MAG: hypothetical protein U0136_10735 [Bdellovibrionota bacterium]
MKNYAIALAAGCLVLVSNDCRAQRLHAEDVPSALEETFTVMYPDFQLLFWEKQGDNYSATFKSGKARGSMLFDYNANLLETESEIPVEDLPKAVSAAAQKQLQEQKIVGAGKIVDSHDRTIFKVKSDTTGFVVDRQGNILRKYKID